MPETASPVVAYAPVDLSITTAFDAAYEDAFQKAGSEGKRVITPEEKRAIKILKAVLDQNVSTLPNITDADIEAILTMHMDDTFRMEELYPTTKGLLAGFDSIVKNEAVLQSAVEKRIEIFGKAASTEVNKAKLASLQSKSTLLHQKLTDYISRHSGLEAEKKTMLRNIILYYTWSNANSEKFIETLNEDKDVFKDNIYICRGPLIQLILYGNSCNPEAAPTPLNTFLHEQLKCAAEITRKISIGDLNVDASSNFLTLAFDSRAMSDDDFDNFMDSEHFKVFLKDIPALIESTKCAITNYITANLLINPPPILNFNRITKALNKLEEATLSHTEYADDVKIKIGTSLMNIFITLSSHAPKNNASFKESLHALMGVFLNSIECISSDGLPDVFQNLATLFLSEFNFSELAKDERFKENYQLFFDPKDLAMIAPEEAKELFLTDSSKFGKLLDYIDDFSSFRIIDPYALKHLDYRELRGAKETTPATIAALEAKMEAKPEDTAKLLPVALYLAAISGDTAKLNSLLEKATVENLCLNAPIFNKSLIAILAESVSMEARNEAASTLLQNRAKCFTSILNKATELELYATELDFNSAKFIANRMPLEVAATFFAKANKVEVTPNTDALTIIASSASGVAFQGKSAYLEYADFVAKIEDINSALLGKGKEFTPKFTTPTFQDGTLKLVSKQTCDLIINLVSNLKHRLVGDNPDKEINYQFITNSKILNLIKVSNSDDIEATVKSLFLSLDLSGKKTGIDLLNILANKAFLDNPEGSQVKIVLKTIFEQILKQPSSKYELSYYATKFITENFDNNEALELLHNADKVSITPDFFLTTKMSSNNPLMEAHKDFVDKITKISERAKEPDYYIAIDYDTTLPPSSGIAELDLSLKAQFRARDAKYQLSQLTDRVTPQNIILSVAAIAATIAIVIFLTSNPITLGIVAGALALAVITSVVVTVVQKNRLEALIRDGEEKEEKIIAFEIEPFIDKSVEATKELEKLDLTPEISKAKTALEEARDSVERASARLGRANLMVGKAKADLVEATTNLDGLRTAYSERVLQASKAQEALAAAITNLNKAREHAKSIIELAHKARSRDRLPFEAISVAPAVPSTTLKVPVPIHAISVTPTAGTEAAAAASVPAMPGALAATAAAVLESGADTARAETVTSAFRRYIPSRTVAPTLIPTPEVTARSPSPIPEAAAEAPAPVNAAAAGVYATVPEAEVPAPVTTPVPVPETEAEAVPEAGTAGAERAGTPLAPSPTPAPGALATAPIPMAMGAHPAHTADLPLPAAGGADIHNGKDMGLILTVVSEEADVGVMSAIRQLLNLITPSNLVRMERDLASTTLSTSATTTALGSATRSALGRVPEPDLEEKPNTIKAPTVQRINNKPGTSLGH